ncbi:MAG: group 1 truncated hemoglobin [Candidatus Cybelea sp.]
MTLAGGGSPARAQQASPPPMSFYTQLGGYDAIAAVTDDLIGRLATDPKLAKFFVGLNDAHKAILRQHFVEFLCAKTGGPCIYTGQDMKAAHAGLRITEDEWNAAIADFGQTEDKFSIPQPLRAQIADLFAQIKADIVTAP